MFIEVLESDSGRNVVINLDHISHIFPVKEKAVFRMDNSYIIYSDTPYLEVKDKLSQITGRTI